MTSHINQRGEPVVEEHIYRVDELRDTDVKSFLVALAKYLELDVVRINATDDGGQMIELRDWT